MHGRDTTSQIAGPRAYHLAHWLFTAALLCVALPAFAQIAPVHGPTLNWVRLTGAESCIGPVTLARRIEARLGRAVFVRASDAILVIEGRIELAAAGGFMSVIRVSDADGTLYGTRELAVQSHDCRSLDELLVLVIAVTIRHPDGGASGIPLPLEISAQLDSLFAADSSEPNANELPAAPRAELQAPDVQRTAVVAARATPSTWHFSAEAGAVLSTGLQPSATWGPVIRVLVRSLGVGSLALSASLGLTQERRITTEMRGSLAYQPMLFGLSGCRSAWHSRSSELAGCVDARIGRLAITAEGFRNNPGAQKLWVELAPGLDARTQLFAHADLHLRLGMPIRLTRPSFEYRDAQGKPKPVATVTGLGFELALSLAVVL